MPRDFKQDYVNVVEDCPDFFVVLRRERSKDSFKMWVLIPKGLDMLAKQREKVRTRSIGVEQADECLISDPEFCAE